MEPVLVRVEPEHEPDAALLLVTAEIDGEPGEFVLDTGAARSAIVVADPGPSPDADDASSDSRGVLGAARDLRRVVVSKLTLGPIVRHDLAVDVRRATASGARAVLGLDVLGGHRWDLYPQQGVLVLDGDATVESWHPLTVSPHGHPHMDVAVGGTSACAVWDTGASVSAVDRKFVAAHPQAFEPVGPSRGIDAEGNAAETPMVMITGMSIGGRLFPPSIAAVVDLAGLPSTGPAFELILGHPVIGRANWSVDALRERWGFLPGVS